MIEGFLVMIELSQIAKLLGGRIRTLRKKMMLKQSQFAQMVGMSRDAIGLIERGKKLPRLESLYKIASNLNISLSKLLDFESAVVSKKKPSKDFLSSLNLYLKTKSPQEVKLVHDIIKNIFDKIPSLYKKPHHKS